MTTPLTFIPEYSEDLPGTSYEEGGFKRVRNIQGMLAAMIRLKFRESVENPVLLTEMGFYGGMFEPESDDEYDIIINCGENSISFSDTSSAKTFNHLMLWLSTY